MSWDILNRIDGKIRFTDKDYEILRSLKPVRETSEYIEKITVWKKDINPLMNIRTSALIQLMASYVEFPETFIQKYNVQPYHISLIKRMYFDFEDLDDYITLRYKRPYGNSDVMYDIFEEYTKIVNVDDDPSGWIDDNYENLLEIHYETLDIFDKVLKELELKSTEWEKDKTKNFNRYYLPTKRGVREYNKKIRNKKLERI